MTDSPRDVNAAAAIGGTLRSPTVAIIGNPNSGKTTVFNGLTGNRQEIGNWPGVTVEKFEGSFLANAADRLLVTPFLPNDATFGRPQAADAGFQTAADRPIKIVDLPGIYSISAGSQDEVVARDYLLSGEPDLVVNVVDASNVQRNLFLTLQLIELQIPLVIVLNMMDVAAKAGIDVDQHHLSDHLGCRVVGVTATNTADIARLKAEIAQALENPTVSGLRVEYPEPIEAALATVLPSIEPVAARTAAATRWLGLALLCGDPWVVHHHRSVDPAAAERTQAVIATTVRTLGEDVDVAIADAKYGVIHGLTRHVTRRRLDRATFTDRVDWIVLNRVLALPVFFAVMYGVFGFTMSVGGGFIDFFDILLGSVFVDGFGYLLATWGAPDWLVGMLAGGIGSGIQTVGTFVPIIFALFLALAVVEDSGYMARAAYVMDRFMRSIGLPGRSFVPMMVGFGCTVPAIMATRTLDSQRDRFVTIFMSTFMSCGARLPVYALFAAAFFGGHSGLIVFSLYLIGIATAVVTGFMLKHTLFRGEASHFVMELPPYHAPRLRFVLSQAWQRLRAFVVRAGATIVIIVTLLSFLNTLGTDGSIGNENQPTSVLAAIGRSITPLFSSMGIEPTNWPATVGLFTGVFAKEVIVGTLSSLYAQSAATGASGDSARDGVADSGAGAAADPADQPTIDDSSAGNPSTEGGTAGNFNLWRGIATAFGSIPAAFGIATGNAEAGEDGPDPQLFMRMRANFTPAAAYAYILFVLLYVPCVAAVATAVREMNALLGSVLIVYTAVVAWSVATLFYQFASTPQITPVAVAIGLLVALVGGLAALGRTRFSGIAAPPA